MTRQEAIWWVNHLFEIRKEEYFNKGMLQDAREVDKARQIVICALQTEVVRCRDCRWFDKGENEVDAWSICTRLMGIRDSVIDTDYCSFADRRQEGEVEE